VTRVSDEDRIRRILAKHEANCGCTQHLWFTTKCPCGRTGVIGCAECGEIVTLFASRPWCEHYVEAKRSGQFALDEGDEGES
jgi:hypothetical protein